MLTGTLPSIGIIELGRKSWLTGIALDCPKQKDIVVPGSCKSAMSVTFGRDDQLIDGRKQAHGDGVSPVSTG